MSSENSPPPTPTSTSNRRASFAPGQKLSELFGRSPPTANGITPYPSPIATAAANAQAQQRRRKSIAGLAGSPTQTSPFSDMRNRQSSFGSSTSPSTSIDENAVEDGDAIANNSPTTPPATQFGRRLSFGARALREVRTGIGNGNGRASSHPASALSPKGRGEGFDWSEQIKNRAERSASINNRPFPGSGSRTLEHRKAGSIASVEQPLKEMPASPKAPKKPDHFQERILKGDFYMD